MSSLFDLPFDEERPVPEARPPASSRTNPYSVTELTADIRGVLETGFADVYV
jgi:hypothetical protein